ncbi:MAG: hypothetical protein P9F19_12070 [Candidatus Contendobacter sp.]|nr:hypothetical protein [Candidatus Contendobacter sp.]MDG4558104.1 hypothetical protein [Candidatus Contendobacter sp.]
MEPTFKLSALGIRPDQDPQTVRTQLQAFLKGDPTDFEATFHRLSLNQPVVLGEGIPRAKAENLLEKFTALGLDCRLDPMTLSLIPMEETGQAAFYQCPACGHRQAPATNNQPDICERCGVVGRNYAATSELKQALELERRRVKTLMGHEEEAEEREKARQRQEKLRAIAKRQVEKEMGITSADKLKALFKPGAPLPVIGGMATAAIGIGLLVWQLQTEKPAEINNASASANTDTSAGAKVGKPAGLQLTINAPDAVFKVEGAKSSPAQASTDNPTPGTAAAGAAPLQEAAGTGSKPASVIATAILATGSKPTAGGAPISTAGRIGTVQTPPPATKGTATTATPTTGGSTPSPATPPETGPKPLLDVGKLALVTPVPGGTGASGKMVRPAARDPQLLTGLALYQLETGDLPATIRSIEQAVEVLGAEHSNLSSAQLDAFNRQQVDIRAGIASQYFRRQEPATAQNHWFRATNLANSIVTPSERAQTFSSLARTLHEVQASTAKDYFNRAIETARTIPDPSSKALTFGAIARDLAHTSRLEQSQDWFVQAAAAASTIQDRPSRLIALVALARQRAEAGDTAAAHALLTQIDNDIAAGGDALPPEFNQYRAKARSALALSRVAGGDRVLARTDFATALNQTQQLPDPTMRADALLYLARDIAAAGDRDAAAKLVAAAGTWN